MRPYSKSRVDRYFHGSRLLRERGWRGVGDMPGEWYWHDGTVFDCVPSTFEQAIRAQGLYGELMAATWSDLRARIAVILDRIAYRTAVSFNTYPIHGPDWDAHWDRPRPRARR